MKDENKSNGLKDSGLVWLTFLTSVSTLLCCTFPVIFVALGFGAALAAMSTQLHWWIVLAEYKFWLFLISGLLLIFTYWTLTRSEQSCPIDPELAKKCKRLLRINYIILFISLCIWLIGFFSAYLAAPLASLIGY